MRIFHDSWLMFKRSMTAIIRTPEAMFMAIINPVVVMILFGAIFGNMVDMEGFSYISFIVPAIVLQGIAQGITSTAISLSNDMSKGIVDRFRSMPISKSSLLTGHAMTCIVMNLITTAVVIAVAIPVGFRPQASFLSWFAIGGIIILFTTAMTWLAVLAGVKAKAADAVTGYLFPLFILPFVSSGFAPVETMPAWMRWFATHQPMTHVIDALRGLMLDMPSGNAIPLALAWCVGITVAAFGFSVRAYKRKVS